MIYAYAIATFLSTTLTVDSSLRPRSMVWAAFASLQGGPKYNVMRDQITGTPPYSQGYGLDLVFWSIVIKFA